MNNNEIKVPKLRFYGFDQDWDRYKCGDVLIERNIQHPQSDDFPLVSFTVENGVTPKTERYDREQLVEGDKKAKKYKQTQLNDIVYNPANLKFGAIARNKYGNAVFSPIYVTFKVNEDLAVPSFVEMTVTKDDFIRTALKYQQGTVYERMSVNSEDFVLLNIYLPSKLEQSEIGLCFDILDKFIALHQNKIAQMYRFKYGMLQKLFPANGASVPEVRLPGFTDDWEQRKLYEVAEFNPKCELPDEFEYVDLESVVGTEMISHRTEAKDSAPSRAQRLAQTGDVFFQMVRPYQRNNYLFAKPDKNYVFSTGYAQMRPHIDTAFLMSFLQTDSFVNAVLDNCTGTSYPAINSKDLSNLGISLPPSSEEQKKIGDTFTSLDNLITLHQRKLQKFIDIKTALLNKLFI